MAGSEFKSNLPGKLKFWAIHCSINALPSYLIVTIWLGQYNKPITHLAMLCAVVTFVIVYAFVTSLPGPLTRKDSLLSRALKVGLILRTICAVWTLLLVPTGILIFYSPDFWCGFFATNVVGAVYEFLGYKTYLSKPLDESITKGMAPGFLEVYLTTILEGLVISLLLFIFSLFAVVILQMRERKKYFSQASESYQRDIE